MDDLGGGEWVLVVDEGGVGVVGDGCLGVVWDEGVKKGVVGRWKVGVVMGGKEMGRGDGGIGVLVGVRVWVEGVNGGYMMG